MLWILWMVRRRYCLNPCPQRSGRKHVMLAIVVVVQEVEELVIQLASPPKKISKGVLGRKVPQSDTERLTGA